MLDIAEIGLKRNLLTPIADASPIFATMNRRLAGVHAAPARAAEVMRALTDAPTTAHFIATLDRIRQVPPRYQAMCCELAWKDFAVRARGLPTERMETALTTLLTDLPAGLLADPPAWERALDILTGRRDVTPSHGMIERLLRLSLQAPAASPAAAADRWNDLLCLIGRFGTASRRPAQGFDLPGLSPERQADIATALACVGRRSQLGTAAEIETLIDRIETTVSAPARWTMFQLLQRFWPPMLVAESARGRAALRSAMLRIEGPGRADALVSLPQIHPLSAQQQLVMDEAGKLEAPAAMRLLRHRVRDFDASPRSRERFLERCESLVTQAATQPDALREVLTDISIAAVQARDQVQRRALSRLALRECTRLDIRQRVCLMALLDPQHLMGGSWRRAWLPALRELADLPDADSRAGHLRVVEALVPRLRLRNSRTATLSALETVLSRLGADDRARVLHDIAHRLQLLGGACIDADFDILARLCAGLPFHLRKIALEPLAGLANRLSQRCFVQLENLLQQTIAEHQARTAELQPANG